MKGTPRYISSDVYIDDFIACTFGDRLVVSRNVIFLTHDYSLTTGLLSIGEELNSDFAFERKITIGCNVFIGLNSIILPGTSIGNNVIVGAGSVVRGVIPDNSIVLGNPATIVGRLSDKAIIWKSSLDSTKIRID